jgi:hypothetical protein
VARREQDVHAANGQRFVSHPRSSNRRCRLPTSPRWHYPPPARATLPRCLRAHGQMQMRPPRVGKPAHGFRMIGREARRIRDRAAELFNPVPSRQAPWQQQRAMIEIGSRHGPQTLVRLPDLGASRNSIHTGAWSLASSLPRIPRSTLAARTRSTRERLTRMWSSRKPALRSHRFRL